jgi:predicted porin
LTCAIAATAHAQTSVTLYGVADGDVRLDHTNVGTLKSLGSGGESGTRWGLRGSEDLGGGLKANFVFEQGFDLGDNSVPQGNITGATPTTNTSSTGSRLFSRIATVGLSGDFGAVRLGRDYKPTFLTYAIYEPYGAGYVATFGNIAIRNVARYDNAVFYDTPRVAGFQFNAAYAVGESTTNTSPGTPKTAGNKYGFSASYLVGSFTLAYGYGNEKAVATSPLLSNGLNRNTFNDVSATYDFGLAKLALVGWKVKDKLGFDVLSYFGGVTVPFGAWTFRAGAGHLDDRGASNPAAPTVKTHYDANYFGAAATYSLSKRTDLYSSWSRLNIKNGGAYTITDSAAPTTGLYTATNIVGVNPWSAEVGISHRF